MSQILSRILHIGNKLKSHCFAAAAAALQKCRQYGLVCGRSVPLELKGVYLESQSWADLRDVQASDLLDDGCLSRVVESAEGMKKLVSIITYQACRSLQR